MAYETDILSPNYWKQFGNLYTGARAISEAYRDLGGMASEEAQLAGRQLAEKFSPTTNLAKTIYGKTAQFFTDPIAEQNKFRQSYAREMAPGPEGMLPFTQKGLELASSVFGETKPDYLSTPFDFTPAPTTQEYKAPKTDQLIPAGAASTAQQGGITTPAQNQAQAGKTQSNYIQDAHDAVMDLMKGGKAIPRGMVEPEAGSGKMSGLDLSQYNRVERDIAGNIIGLSGRMQVGPSGRSLTKMTPDWQASQMEVSKTGQPGPKESVQSAVNRQLFLESKKPKPSIQNPKNVFSEAFKQTKKPEEITA